MSNSINPDMVGVDTPVVQPLQAFTPPDPVIVEPEEKHYYCSVPNASFYKHDGTRLGFVNGFFSSNIKAIKDYLDNEIANGHVAAYLRYANKTEVARIMSIRNPLAALEEDFKINREPELRQKLEREIVASIMGVPVSQVTQEIADTFMKRSSSEGMKTTVDPEEIKRRLAFLGGSAADKMENFTEVSENTRTVVGEKKDPFIPMESKPSPIASGMVGSDKLGGAQAASDMTNPGASTSSNSNPSSSSLSSLANKL